MFVLSEIIPPPAAPQDSAPMCASSPPTLVDEIDQSLLHHLHAIGSCPTWTLINLVADAQSPDGRSVRRKLSRDLLERLKRLKQLELVHGLGRNWVSITKPVPRRRKPNSPRSKASVNISPSKDCDSVAKPAPAELPPLTRLCVDPHLTIANCDLARSRHEPSTIQCENDRALIREAASHLGRMPRRPKRKWSGWIGEVRSYRNMRVRLADGQIVYVFGTRRGHLVYTLEPDGPAGDFDSIRILWGVVPASTVEIIRNEHAVTLGRLKRGVRERPSEAKARAACENGRKPCREGVTRGRPRRGSR
jgi:hypothetical protein